MLIVLGSRSASGSGPGRFCRAAPPPGLKPLQPNVEASDTMPSDAALLVALVVLGVLVVLDASWSQAKHMLQRVPELLRLPRLSLVAPEGRRSLRKSPPGGMSSLEAIAHALALLEGAEVAAPVHAAHEALVQKQLSQRGYVGPMK